MTAVLPPLFILAGGLGTRLRDITHDRCPKPMVPVAIDGASQPFLAFVLARFVAAGGTEAVLCTGHLGAQIPAHFGDGSAFGLTLRYDDMTGADTGARLAHALGRFPVPIAVVTCGDVYLEVDHAALVATLEAHPEWDAVLALTAPGEAVANVVLAGDGRIAAHGPGVPGATWLEAGVFALRPPVFDDTARDPAFSLTRDLFPRLAREGRLGGVPVAGAFHDIGTPSGYEAFAAFVARGEATPLTQKPAPGRLQCGS